MKRILFVCLGNICRSPLAEGIMRRLARQGGVSVVIDSAGTGHWHTGEPPDRRAVLVGQRRGCDMSMRARQVRSSDFQEFDLILALDEENFQDLVSWPDAVPEKVRLIRSFDESADAPGVPDPYYGTIDDFERVADMLEVACAGLLRDLN